MGERLEPGAAAVGVRYACAAAAIGVALVGQQITFRDPSRPAGWLVIGGAIGLIIFAAARQRAANESPTRLASRPRAVPGRLVAFAVVAGAIAVSTALSAADQQPLLALSTWILAWVVGAVGLRAWR